MYQVGVCREKLSRVGNRERWRETEERTLWNRVDREGLLEELTFLRGCLGEEPSRQEKQ